LQTLNSIIATAPNNAEAHYIKAVAYVMLRQYIEAANEYKTVLRLLPGSPLAAKAEAGLKNLKP
jgi:Flp pilus assembly protein TadD